MQNCLGEESLWDYRVGVTFPVPRANEGTGQMCMLMFALEARLIVHLSV